MMLVLLAAPKNRDAGRVDWVGSRGWKGLLEGFDIVEGGTVAS